MKLKHKNYGYLVVQEMGYPFKKFLIKRTTPYERISGFFYGIILGDVGEARIGTNQNPKYVNTPFHWSKKDIVPYLEVKSIHDKLGVYNRKYKFWLEGVVSKK